MGFILAFAKIVISPLNKTLYNLSMMNRLNQTVTDKQGRRVSMRIDRTQENPDINQSDH